MKQLDHQKNSPDLVQCVIGYYYDNVSESHSFLINYENKLRSAKIKASMELIASFNLTLSYQKAERLHSISQQQLRDELWFLLKLEKFLKSHN